MLQTLVGIAAICLISPFSVFAVGLGGIELKSTLDQKLDASINLLSTTDQEFNELKVDLASPAVYERMGIERSIQLEQLRFAVSKTNDGEKIIHVTTPLAVSEPFLNFLIEVNWSSGRLLREFTVLLDPPVFLDGEGPSGVDAPETDLPPVLTSPASTTEIDTPIASISERVEPADNASEKSNIDEEISNILSSDLTSDSDAVSTSSSLKQASSLVYDKVRQGEILWRIADKMRPEDVSVEQMMLALQRENPSAFFGDNVSMLKAGAVLRIEDASVINSVSAENAILEIEKQHQDWLSYRKERQARNAVAAESANLTPIGGESESNAGKSGSMSSASVTNVSNEPLLRLVAPVEKTSDRDGEASNAALEAAEDKVNQLNIELVMANEELEARKRENEDLVTRLNSLEEQMSAMQSLVHLKDAELARLRGEPVPQESQSTLPPLTLELPAEDENNTTVSKVVSKEEATQAAKIWEDPLTLGTAVFAILLIALAGVLLKRKSKHSHSVADKYESVQEKSLDELFPEDDSMQAIKPTIAQERNVPIVGAVTEEKTEKAGAAEKEIITFNTAFDDDLGPMTDIDFDNTIFSESDEELLDPISEADVYLTYEKFDKAEKLLKEAIQSTPDRHELKLKLLEVFVHSNNKDAFNSQLDEFYAAIGGDESHPLWVQAIDFALAIGSDNPLVGNVSEADNLDIELPVIDLDKVELDRIEEQSVAKINSDESTSAEVKTSSEEEGLESITEKANWTPDQVTEFVAQDKDAIDTEIESFDTNAGDVFDPTVLDEIDSELVREPILEKSTVISELSEDSLELSESSSIIDSEIQTVSDQDNVQDLGIEVDVEEVRDKEILAEVVSDEQVLDESANTEESETTEKSKIAQESKEESKEESKKAESTVTISDADLEKAMSSFTEEAINEELVAEKNKQESEITVSDVFEDLPSDEAAPQEKEDTFGDTSFFLLSDEVGTKLDLARAYIEMGDQEGASDLLNEVLAEGNQKQKQEAKDLMELATA